MQTLIRLSAFSLVVAFALLLTQETGAQTGAQKPSAVPLFFRETFASQQPNSPTQIPVTEKHALNPNLELKLYGAGAKQPSGYKGRINDSGLLLNQGEDEARPGENVSYIWSGVTGDNWGITLRDKNNLVDLTGTAKIRWRTRYRSFYNLHLLIKLADGTMLAADYAEPEATYWRETEFYLVDVPRWRVINVETMNVDRDNAYRTNVDLSRVDEIGWTDLRRGAGHGTQGNTGVDWIEVHGKPVKR